MITCHVNEGSIAHILGFWSSCAQNGLLSTQALGFVVHLRRYLPNIAHGWFPSLRPKRPNQMKLRLVTRKLRARDHVSRAGNISDASYWQFPTFLPQVAH